MTHLRIVPAIDTDTRVILDLIQSLAEYEKLRHTVTATSERLRQTLFGTKPAAEVILAYWNEECAGFAVFFATYSTFLAQPGLYLEDLYVKPHFRGKGIGSELLSYVTRVAAERGCGRLEWGTLDWNASAIKFLSKLGAAALDEWSKYRHTAEALQCFAPGH